MGHELTICYEYYKPGILKTKPFYSVTLPYYAEHNRFLVDSSGNTEIGVDLNVKDKVGSNTQTINSAWEVGQYEVDASDSIRVIYDSHFTNTFRYWILLLCF